MNTGQGKERAVFKIIGEVDHHNAKSIKERLSKAILKNDIKEMVIDLSELRFMDSSGIGVIIGRYKELKKRGGFLYVKKPNKTIDKLFKLSGVYQLVKKIDQ